jgi:hypothetical protein
MTRHEICVHCEHEFIQTANAATGIHRNLCAAAGPDSRTWIAMDAKFMQGPDGNCPEGKWVNAVENPAPAPQRVDLTNCQPCKEKLLAAMKSSGHSPLSTDHFAISVVIASLNEKDHLTATIASVKHDCPEAEIIVVDDASDVPEPIVTIRNPSRLGGPRSRRLGALRATGDVVIFLDAHNALDWETACWFAAKYPEIGPVKPEFKEMLDRPNKLRTLAAAALTAEARSTQRTNSPVENAVAKDSVLSDLRVSAVKNGAIVYGGCMFSCGRAGACLVPEKGMLGGRWMKRRPDLPALELWPTSLMMGAFYAIPRAILDRFGGWPALPNFHGAQELSVALLAAAHKVPILFHDGVALWHLFRGAKTGVEPPFHTTMDNGAWLGYAAAWRLVLDDAHWADYRARVAAGEGPHGAIPEQVLRQVETEEFNRYRADAQSRFVVKNSDELLAELDRRIAADRESRVQGAEDKVLNIGKKILMAITFTAENLTSSGPTTLEEKRQILGRCLESARASGADEIRLFVNGEQMAEVASWPEIADVPVFWGARNKGLPLGETQLVQAMIDRAVSGGFEWVVKICGDVFHPHPNWAKELVGRAMAAREGTPAALVAGVCNNGCTVTKVFAARTDFLQRTWPEDSEVAPLGAGAVLERIWTAKIERLGLTNLWLKLPCYRAAAFGAHWWAPTDPKLRYEHTHDAATAAKWRMEK